ncbi:recombination protein RecT [Mycobacterium aquaticum]|uniref:Recombinase RecT n=1 Tax=Mycobacterium aquaticum TaxID=1927124 RepID=A0A1X0B787_9MYCO|nr:recombination protein RecT [Mycobacterium aquaticum]ORA38075.1 recombinase RecT [Mycobacterium aquaticum]
MARDLARRAQQSVATQGRGDEDSLQVKIQKMEKSFQLAMPRGVEATQLIRDALTCLQVNPKLAECEPKSVLGSLMTCAQLGLRPGVGALGQAYLLPFWDSKTRGQKAQLVIGYQGYVELAHRSGRIASIHARTVYSNDYFEVEYGAAEDKWIHRPCIDGPRGKPILFYAVGRTVDGGYSMTDPMTVADMEAYRDRHATAKNRDGKVFGPWVDHFEAMAHKTMVRKLMKLLPKSTEAQRAIAQDEGVRLDLSPDAINQTPDFIDGEVDDSPVENEQVVDGQATETMMATEDQLDRMAQIQKAEKYDSDDEWFSYLGDAAGVKARRTADMTYDEAAAVISLFDGPGA